MTSKPDFKDTPLFDVALRNGEIPGLRI